MSHILELTECLKPADQASTLPPAVYTSNKIVEQEIEQIFRTGWICVGRSDLIEKTGDFTTLDIADQAIILSRDKSGQVCAVANTCRHRGARLVDGTGNCRGLRCPFHSWFYGLDGRLVNAPRMDDVPGFDKSEHGLKSYAAAERFGFIFVNLADAPNDIDEQLGDFGDIHAPWPMDSLTTIRRQEMEVDCNWKMFLEVFNEYYHLPFVHPDSIDSVYGEPDPADKVTGAFATQFGATDGSGALLETAQDNALPPMPNLTGRAVHGARYTWVFPNVAFAANHDALWAYEAYPLGATRCKVVQSACFPPETVALPDFETKVQAYLERLDAALDEDIPALVNQQRGMSHPDAMQGRFQPDLEPNVASFAHWYAEHMTK